MHGDLIHHWSLTSLYDIQHATSRRSVELSKCPCGAVLFPAVVVCRRVFFRGRPAAGTLMAAAALLNPAAVLIDHGHFQYNGISLGLSVLTSIRHPPSPLPSPPLVPSPQHCAHNPTYHTILPPHPFVTVAATNSIVSEFPASLLELRRLGL